MDLLLTSEHNAPPRFRLSGIRVGSYCELRDDTGRPLLTLVIEVNHEQRRASYIGLLEHTDGPTQRGESIKFKKSHVWQVY